MTTGTSVSHYVNNKEFHAALVERKSSIDSGNIEEKPPISNYIGGCFLKMANNIAHKHNFNRYAFKDEMISDGIVDCIKYIDSFDTTRTNPFAYFTQAINNAFIRRIIKEKKQAYIKLKLLSSSKINVHDLQEQDEDGEFINAFKNYMNSYNNFDGSMFEKKIRDRAEKSYTGGTIEEFEGE